MLNGQYDDDMERVDLVVIDVSKVLETTELHKILKKELSFPYFYGNNWDAFWDAITGLVAVPKRLTFIGWSNLTKNLPRDAKILKECLDEKNNLYPSTFIEVEYK